TTTWTLHSAFTHIQKFQDPSDEETIRLALESIYTNAPVFGAALLEAGVDGGDQIRIGEYNLGDNNPGRNMVTVHSIQSSACGRAWLRRAGAHMRGSVGQKSALSP